MKEVDYTQLLTDEDKIRIYFKKRRGKIEKFIVQYFGLINGKWRSIMRIDTCHSYPHQHTYHLHKSEVVLVLSEDNNKAFTVAHNHIVHNFAKIKENFLFAK